MTRYAASSITAFVPPGGVCKGHTIEDPKADEEYPFLSVSCQVCEPYLAKDELWSGSAETRPLTEAEQREAERKKAEADVAMANFSQAFMASFTAQQAAFVAAQQKAAEEPESKPEPEAKKAAPRARTRKSSGASA